MTCRKSEDSFELKGCGMADLRCGARLNALSRDLERKRLPKRTSKHDVETAQAMRSLVAYRLVTGGGLATGAWHHRVLQLGRRLLIRHK
jgi:hypothetical protein